MTNERDMTPSSDAVADDRLVERVVKLLAMAEGTSNPNEARAFADKAASLIAEHRLDPARMRVAHTDELDVHEVPLGRGAYVRARLSLLQAVAEAHGCSVVFRAGRSGTTAFVAGFRSDLESVRLLHGSLHAQAATRMAAERRSTGAATQRWRRSFLIGFAHRVSQLLATSTAAVERHAAGSDLLPALRDRDHRIQEHLAQRFGHIARARPAAAPGADGYLAGTSAAARSDLGRTRLAAARGLGPGSAT